MLNAIKQAAIDAVGAAKPVEIYIGLVKSIGPIEIFVHQKLSLTSEFLYIPERLTRYEVSLLHNHAFDDSVGSTTISKTTEDALSDVLVIREGLKIGDKVLMARVQGGYKYAVIDKVVEE